MTSHSNVQRPREKSAEAPSNRECSSRASLQGYSRGAFQDRLQAFGSHEAVDGAESAAAGGCPDPRTPPLSKFTVQEYNFKSAGFFGSKMNVRSSAVRLAHGDWVHGAFPKPLLRKEEAQSADLPAPQVQPDRLPRSPSAAASGGAPAASVQQQHSSTADAAAGEPADLEASEWRQLRARAARRRGEAPGHATAAEHAARPQHAALDVSSSQQPMHVTRAAVSGRDCAAAAEPSEAAPRAQLVLPNNQSKAAEHRHAVPAATEVSAAAHAAASASAPVPAAAAPQVHDAARPTAVHAAPTQHAPGNDGRPNDRQQDAGKPASILAAGSPVKRQPQRLRCTLSDLISLSGAAPAAAAGTCRQAVCSMPVEARPQSADSSLRHLQSISIRELPPLVAPARDCAAAAAGPFTEVTNVLPPEIASTLQHGARAKALAAAIDLANTSQAAVAAAQLTRQLGTDSSAMPPTERRDDAWTPARREPSTRRGSSAAATGTDDVESARANAGRPGIPAVAKQVSGSQSVTGVAAAHSQADSQDSSSSSSSQRMTARDVQAAARQPRAGRAQPAEAKTTSMKKGTSIDSSQRQSRRTCGAGGSGSSSSSSNSSHDTALASAGTDCDIGTSSSSNASTRSHSTYHTVAEPRLRRSGSESSRLSKRRRPATASQLEDAALPQMSANSLRTLGRAGAQSVKHRVPQPAIAPATVREPAARPINGRARVSSLQPVRAGAPVASSSALGAPSQSRRLAAAPQVRVATQPRELLPYSCAATASRTAAAPAAEGHQATSGAATRQGNSNGTLSNQLLADGAAPGTTAAAEVGSASLAVRATAAAPGAAAQRATPLLQPSPRKRQPSTPKQQPAAARQSGGYADIAAARKERTAAAGVRKRTAAHGAARSQGAALPASAAASAAGKPPLAPAHEGDMEAGIVVALRKGDRSGALELLAMCNRDAKVAASAGSPSNPIVGVIHQVYHRPALDRTPSGSPAGSPARPRSDSAPCSPAALQASSSPLRDGLATITASHAAGAESGQEVASGDHKPLDRSRSAAKADSSAAVAAADDTASSGTASWLPDSHRNPFMELIGERFPQRDIAPASQGSGDGPENGTSAASAEAPVAGPMAASAASLFAELGVQDLKPQLQRHSPLTLAEAAAAAAPPTNGRSNGNNGELPFARQRPPQPDRRVYEDGEPAQSRKCFCCFCPSKQ